MPASRAGLVHDNRGPVAFYDDRRGCVPLNHYRCGRIALDNDGRRRHVDRVRGDASADETADDTSD
jgi:hypothetical protein